MATFHLTIHYVRTGCLKNNLFEDVELDEMYCPTKQSYVDTHIWVGALCSSNSLKLRFFFLLQNILIYSLLLSSCAVFELHYL